METTRWTAEEGSMGPQTEDKGRGVRAHACAQTRASVWARAYSHACAHTAGARSFSGTERGRQPACAFARVRCRQSCARAGRIGAGMKLLGRHLIAITLLPFCENPGKQK
eukprot:2915473-Pleurochrysis_carterae.AAC.1